MEEQNLVRAGLCALLRRIRGVRVVGEAADGFGAVAKTLELRPDVVMMAVALPALNGIQATARIVKESKRTRVLIVSMHSGEEYVRRAFEAGATGYMSKDSPAAELERAIRAVNRGERYLSPTVSRHFLEEFALNPEGPRVTPRQREVLRLLGEGATSKQAAARLGLSVKTVEAHRAALMRRLGAHDLAALIRWAMRLHLVPGEP